VSHNPQLSAAALLAAQNAAADAVCALLNGGTIKIYTSPQPATADTAITTQTLLATMTFGSPAFASAVVGVATAHAVTDDSDADNSGTAAFFRTLTSAAAPVFDGTVGTSDSFDCVLSSTSIIAHGICSLTSVTYSQSAS